MTKYIDRYYLNGELYGIKFGGGGWSMDDSFPGTSLNTDLWTATNYGGATATYTVNNGLSLSKTSGRGGYAVYTNKTFEGTEKTITYGISISAEGGTYRESTYWLFGITNYTDIDYNPYTPNNFPTIGFEESTFDNTARIMERDGAASVSNTSYGMVSTPYVLKYVVDVDNWSCDVYVNNSLLDTKNLYGTKADVIGQPLFSIACISWTNISCSISNVKIDII